MCVWWVGGCVCSQTDVQGAQDCTMINNCRKIRPNEMRPNGLDLCGLHVFSFR